VDLSALMSVTCVYLQAFGRLCIYAYIHIHVLRYIQVCVNVVSIHCQGTECIVISAGSDIHCTSSYLGVTPVALTNADATANEATQGAPITGPGLAGPSPPSTHIPPASAPSLKSEAAQAPEQVGCSKQPRPLIFMLA